MDLVRFLGHEFQTEAAINNPPPQYIITSDPKANLPTINKTAEQMPTESGPYP